MPADQIAGPDGAGEAIFAVIGQPDSLLLIVEGDDVADGAEHLLLHAARILGEAGPDRGLDVPAARLRAGQFRDAAAGHDLRAFFAGEVIIGQHLVAMAAGDERAHFGPAVPWVAQAHCLGLFRERGDEAVVDGALDIDALCAEADLAGVEEGGAGHAFDGLVEIAVGKDQRCVLAAQFEGDRANALCRLAHDRGAGLRFAGEGDGVDALRRDDGLSGRIGTEAVDEVEHAVGGAGLLHDFGQQGRGSGGFLRRLGDDDIAAGEGGCDLPAEEQQRQVPGRDHADHAQRAAQRVVERAAAVGRGAFIDLARRGADDVGEGAEIRRAPRYVERSRQRGRLARVARRGADDVGEGAEIRRAPRYVERSRQRGRLARIPDLRLQEVGLAPVDGVGDPIQQTRTLLDRRSAPCAVQRASGGADRLLDHPLVRLMHDGAHAAGRRIDVLEPAGAFDETAVDEIPVVHFGHIYSRRRLRGPSPDAAARPAIASDETPVGPCSGGATGRKCQFLFKILIIEILKPISKT
ncbi:hypothetical protein A8O16_03650 [Sphingobium sp. 20006FA]|nr:hypothetical protein A8O16_03650 [Sphingobium sp. 20006FA]